jgi:hypothetical protein
MKTVRDYTNGSVFLTIERVVKLQNKKKLRFQISFSTRRRVYFFLQGIKITW